MGFTAAMIASQNGHEGCLQLLLGAGANLEHLNKVLWGFWRLRARVRRMSEMRWVKLSWMGGWVYDWLSEWVIACVHDLVIERVSEWVSVVCLWRSESAIEWCVGWGRYNQRIRMSNLELVTSFRLFSFCIMRVVCLLLLFWFCASSLLFYFYLLLLMTRAVGIAHYLG